MAYFSTTLSTGSRQRGREGRRRFYNNPDRMIMGLTCTLVTLLRPWIKRLTMIISARWLRTSSKFMWKEVKRQQEKLENGLLLSGCGIIQRRGPPSLSRDRRIKMHHSSSKTFVT